MVSSPIHLASVFKALADATRQKIVEMLMEHDMAAGEIAAAFDMAQPSVSHHLNVLKQAGLIRDRREGQSIIYSLDREAIEACRATAFVQKIFVRKR